MVLRFGFALQCSFLFLFLFLFQFFLFFFREVLVRVKFELSNNGVFDSKLLHEGWTQLDIVDETSVLHRVAVLRLEGKLPLANLPASENVPSFTCLLTFVITICIYRLSDLSFEDVHK